MSFFFPVPAKQKQHRGGMKAADVKIYQQLGCDACPLAKLDDNKHPHMEPAGAEEPTIYLLGEAPTREDDYRGRHFTGDSGEILRKVLRDVVGSDYKDIVRWNNVVRTCPRLDDKGNRASPPWEAIEACRPSIIADIEATKPKAIFGFGNLPIQWLYGASGIYAWRGRCMPVKVGNHACWFFPMLDPYEINEQQGFRRSTGDEDDEEIDFKNEDHRMFRLDIEKAWNRLQTLGEPIVHTPDMALAGIQIVDQCDDEGLRIIENALSNLKDSVIVGIDYETNTLRPYSDGALVLSAAVSDGKNTISFPFDHPSAEWSKSNKRALTRLWQNFLTEATAIKAVHNLQFEQEWTAVKFGPELLRAGRWECTQVQASIIDHRYRGTEPGPLSLDFLIRQYFGFNLKALSGVDRGNLAATPLPHVLQYNGLDAKYHCLLYRKQVPIIRNEKLEGTYKFAIRRVPTLVLSQVKGVPVSQKRVNKLAVKYKALVEEAEATIQKHRLIRRFEREFSQKFNPHSNSDCVKLFYKMLKRRECEVYDKKRKNVVPWPGGVDGKTKVNKISCDKEVLKQLDHELADEILKMRKAHKLLGTYVLPLMDGSELMYPDGKLHPIFNHTFTDTGRLSCDSPNMQNFPKRSDDSKEVRRSIKPPPGHVVLSIDYGQIEARVIAMYTRDKVFCKALWERYDVHGEWAERIARAYPDRVGGKKMLTDKKAMKDFRTDIKNQWTFPLFFGAALSSASHYLKIPEEVLKPLYEEFWKTFEGVKTWQEKLIKFYEEHGYVETYTGRRRYGPMSVNKVINSPVQGFTCEFVLDGMCRLSETGDPLLQPEIQIHDDLTWVAVPVEKVDYVADKALDVLLTPSDEFKDFICVPITLEMSIGDDWLKMEEVGVFSSDD